MSKRARHTCEEELEEASKELEEMKSKSLSAENEAIEAEEQLSKASKAAAARSKAILKALRYSLITLTWRFRMGFKRSPRASLYRRTT